MPLETELKCHISKKSRVLSLPKSLGDNTRINLVIICMGTGVVPFISMLKRIEHLNAQNVHIRMFYAVRSDKKDFCYYSDFLKEYFSKFEDAKSNLTLACSREITGAFEGAKNVNVREGYL